MEITNIELYTSFCKQKFPNQTLILVDNFEEDSVRSESTWDFVVEKLSSIVDLKAITTNESIVMISEIPKEKIHEILVEAHENKWDWGSYIYIWNGSNIIWGRE